MLVESWPQNLDVKEISKLIRKWGKEHYQAYPWRETDNPWFALLAEVLLQRTRAQQVASQFEVLCTQFPTPQALVAADVEALKQLTAHLGLPRRIQTLQEIADHIVKSGRYPSHLEELMSYHGVGHYTAAAWLSLHRDVYAILIDSNIARWLARLTGNPRPTDPRHTAWLWELARELTPRQRVKSYNYAVIDFTMITCTPRSPKCSECPISHYCHYYVNRTSFEENQ